jgi:hypothetical protein
MPAASKPDVSTKNYLTLPAGEYPCGNNLYLIVAPSGGRRWLFKYQRDGVKESMGFGAAKDVTFIEAKDMQRDRIMTGVQHGAIDFEWLLANLEIGTVPYGVDQEALGDIETFVLGPKAIYAAEAFVLGLFQL